MAYDDQDMEMWDDAEFLIVSGYKLGHERLIKPEIIDDTPK
nr:hypothetical protein [Tanacetum cinerariifolium]